MLPRVEHHLAELRSADADAVRARAGEATDLDPALAARAPHRTAYRGLEVLTVYLEARRRLLFDRFREFWAEQEQGGHLGAARARRRAHAGGGADRAARRASVPPRPRQELAEAERAEREAAERASRAAEELRRRPAGERARSG